ncbi:hypothetical protein WA026_009277 [Henosepilachna vigintioctopunctata]|uniref:Uncharacterized protein n=1 Tax=Henosepilachna vigintioctopunctata TaxID=420089 RepID=A0AAW1UVY2_9CUCU
MCPMQKLIALTYLILSCFSFITSEVAAFSDSGQLSNIEANIKSPFTEYFIRKWVTSLTEVTAGRQTNNSYSIELNQERDIPKIITAINTYVGENILLLSENNMKVDYGNTLNLIKRKGHEILGKTLGSNDFILLFLSQRLLDNSIDKLYSELEGSIKISNFSTKMQTRSVRATATSSSLTDIIRKFLSDVLLVIFKPLQVQLNQTIITAINDLMSYYQPLEPPGFFQSIGTSIVNRIILLVVDFLDLQRTAINNLFTTSGTNIARSLIDGNGPRSSRSEMRSIIDVVVAPLNFFAAIIFTPFHTALTIVANIIFTFLRPIFRGTILGQLEGIVRGIINLIPCLNC